MDLDMSNVSRRVFELRKSLGMNQAAFGRLVGVDQSTVSKWESGRQLPDGTQLIKLAELAKQSPREFLGEVEIKPATTINISVIGAVQAGQWLEAMEWPEDARYGVTVLFRPDFRNTKRFGLEVRGPSMNKVYPEGTILDCVSIHDLKRQPVSGQRVIVHRRRADGLVEATCKEYVVDQDGRVWLWPRSDHPEHQQPLRFEPESDVRNGVESVEIAAIVVGSYRPE